MKAQFKIQQMTFMLLAVTLFFIMVGLFWLSFQYTGLKKQASQLNEDKARMIAEFLVSQAEFSCKEAYCIDSDKLLMLQNRSVYGEFWPVSYIKVFSLEGNESICNKANYPNCNVFNVYSNPKIESKSAVGSFVALCRHNKIESFPVQICRLARITIGYEVKS